MKSYQRLLLAAVVSAGLALNAFAAQSDITPIYGITASQSSLTVGASTVLTATSDTFGVRIKIEISSDGVSYVSLNGSGGYYTTTSGNITTTLDTTSLIVGCYYIRAHGDNSEGIKQAKSDPIQVCVTPANSDTTPPVVGCLPTTNPSGKSVPTAGTTAGQSGQNPDGFYELVATDNVTASSDIVVYIRDSVSGYEVEGLTSGAKFKLIQAPGVTPNVKQMKGYVQIQFQGDAIVFGYDAAGNRSLNHECLVPRSPK
jgi:hypothetical protein